MSSNHVCQVCLWAFGSLRGLTTHVNQQSLCRNSHAPAFEPGFQDGRRSPPTPNSRSRLTSDDGVCWSQQSPRSPDGGDGGEADASMSSSSGIGCPEADRRSTSAPNSSVDSDADMMRMDSVRGVSGGVRSNPAEADFPFYPGSDDDSSTSSSSGPPPFSDAPWSTLDGNDGSHEENFGVPEFDRVYGSDSVNNNVEHDSK
jgi:hypothetical protein